MEVDNLFQTGDKVFYPMHGAGIITGIEDKEIQGEWRKYCMIWISITNMNIMIPLSKMEQLGVRSIENHTTMSHILYELHHTKPDDNLPWKERYTINLKKMKIGSMQETMEVFRDLLYRSKEKTLNASEKQMFNQAQKNIISEIVLIDNITENQAEHLLRLSS
jgi:CarD family transcriptional regulator